MQVIDVEIPIWSDRPGNKFAHRTETRVRFRILGEGWGKSWVLGCPIWVRQRILAEPRTER